MSDWEISRHDMELSMTEAFTASSLAKRWNCSVAHIRRMIRRGDLPAFRVGDKLWRISTAVVKDIERREERRLADLLEDIGRWQRLNSDSYSSEDITTLRGKSAAESGARPCGPVIVKLPNER